MMPKPKTNGSRASSSAVNPTIAHALRRRAGTARTNAAAAAIQIARRSNTPSCGHMRCRSYSQPISRVRPLARPRGSRRATNATVGTCVEGLELSLPSISSNDRQRCIDRRSLSPRSIAPLTAAALRERNHPRDAPLYPVRSRAAREPRGPAGRTSTARRATRATNGSM